MALARLEKLKLLCLTEEIFNHEKEPKSGGFCQDIFSKKNVTINSPILGSKKQICDDVWYETLLQCF
jgi:hypothetical protein